MITKMSKLTLLVYHKEYMAFLQNLREVGVVHIEQKNSGAVKDHELEQKLTKANAYANAIRLLEARAPKNLAGAGDISQALHIVEKTNGINAEISRLRSNLNALEKDHESLEPWGNFTYNNVELLEKAGYELRFYTTSVKNYKKEWEEQYNAVIVDETKSRVFFVTIMPRGSELGTEAEQVFLPRRSRTELYNEIRLLRSRIEEENWNLDSFASGNLNTLRAAYESLQHEIEFDQIVLDGEKVSGDKLVLLEGWVPEENVQELKTMLDGSGAFYELRAARRGDSFPVKLKNNAFTRMYEVLTRMYGMPSGTDFDPTPIVAPFFSLFFAFCMGDAGYGLILILLGFILKKKLSKDLAGMMNLVITLGIFTTVIGALLGTFFGISLIQSDIPQELKDFIISGQIELFGSTYDKQMVLALGIGVVHISIAMTVRAINSTFFFGFKDSLSAWGWWLVVVGTVIIGTLTFLSIIPADVSQWALITVGAIGAIGIYILNDLRRNVFINIGAGLWDTYNMASGLLGDILSYVRLFALGLAGGMLGQTFNSLAMMVVDGTSGYWSILGWIGFGLIIIIGHTLNIAMSCLSAFVHPLRLTFVEYFKNAGYDGKGIEYKPFKNY